MPHEDELELAKGVKILNFGPGHAWGLLGLHVELPGEGGIILASDAVYTSESLGPPVKMPGIIYDSIGYLNAVEKIRKYAERTTPKYGLVMTMSNSESLSNQQMDFMNNTR